MKADNDTAKVILDRKNYDVDSFQIRSITECNPELLLKSLLS